MTYVLCYTKPGLGTYPTHNYPGHVALNCDWEHAMHLAISDDGAHFTPLRNNTGILFPKCTFDEGDPRGTTKTLLDPWLMRKADGSFLVCAIRRNQNAPDPKSVGSIMLFTSRDLVRYEEAGFLKVADSAIRAPRCVYDEGKAAYYLEWQDENGSPFCGWTKDFSCVECAAPCVPRLQAAPGFGIEGCIPGNVLEVTEAEAKVIRAYLDDIHNVSVDAPTHTSPVGKPLCAADLPRALCRYNDGSTHEKPVDWDEEALQQVDYSKPGVYEIPGKIRVKRWPFPLPLSYGPYSPANVNDPVMGTGMSDPCVTKYKDKYYLSSSGIHNIVLRCADTIEGTFSADPVIIHSIPLEGQTMVGTWAAELHEIDGVLYLFTTKCPNGEWTLVQSHILRCTGDPLDPAAWEAPRLCVKPNGKPLTEGGISLDMTWFRDHGVDYVMWSDRKIRYGTDPLVVEPADIYIATIDPAAPWQATCEPRCVIRPMYGWDRYETEVDEGPYLLRRGDDMFVTISGSSTGMTDLYDVGILRAKTGTDLLDPANWDWIPYPLLTKESVPGEWGPGHNNFVKDPETGDDLMVYHAVPHDENDKSLNRRPALRRVHWAATGLPYLEMTPEKDLAPGLENITMKLVIE